MSKILDNIKTIRELRGISKKEISVHLGITLASYLKTEAGVTSLTYDRLCCIADFFGMSVIDLITYPDIYTLKVPLSKNSLLEELKRLIRKYE